MAQQPADPGRRRFLTATTAVVGGVGVAAAAVPFISAWKPSARAIAAGAPVTVDISRLQVGGQQIVQWRKRPVWIVRRTPALLEALPAQDDRLKDPDSNVIDQQPDYAKNEYRSLRPDVLVLVGSCTHLGCSPKYHPEMQPVAWDENWQGGFFCPCHNSKFDMAGRVYEGSPAPTNLVVPPYYFVDDNTIVVGVDPEQEAA
ncbi:MAG: ubiquinol-cytochrome c reductase iron-sulfur subunit [Xanthomonadales bacterium]|nr:ubiquinol-cytochrome c reductase iron-sulfur subunit [Xanthomonadales bacterium]MCB1641415.1 ubiquinol-cytochrome c reductase iron-sulfur subunit [Xanthomonadales bacterium]